jgi:hypothetical protein
MSGWSYYYSSLRTRGFLKQARVAVSVLVMERGLGHVARGKEKTFLAGDWSQLRVRST